MKYNNYNRRLFLKNGGLFASGIMLGGIGCAGGGNGNAADGQDTLAGSLKLAAEHGLAQFGLQLYTLRAVIPSDPKGILKQVASFGYKQIEGYEDKLGIWWGMDHKDFKKYLDDIGLTMVSTHCTVSENFEKKAAEAAEVGLKYLIQPWYGPQKTADDYKKATDSFNKLGEVCRKNGIRFAYHNHAYAFVQTEGQYPEDIFMQNTDPSIVDFEMDIYWVVVTGADPIPWLQKYPGRFRLCHVKDRLKNAAPGDDNTSTEVGAGSIDFKSILKVAEANGMQYYIVEQERFDDHTPLESARISADYLKTFTF